MRQRFVSKTVNNYRVKQRTAPYCRATVSPCQRGCDAARTLSTFAAARAGWGAQGVLLCYRCCHSSERRSTIIANLFGYLDIYPWPPVPVTGRSFYQAPSGLPGLLDLLHFFGERDCRAKEPGPGEGLVFAKARKEFHKDGTESSTRRGKVLAGMCPVCCAPMRHPDAWSE